MESRRSAAFTQQAAERSASIQSQRIDARTNTTNIERIKRFVKVTGTEKTGSRRRTVLPMPSVNKCPSAGRLRQRRRLVLLPRPGASSPAASSSSSHGPGHPAAVPDPQRSVHRQHRDHRRGGGEEEEERRRRRRRTGSMEAGEARLPDARGVVRVHC